jgi:hypothetical protein
MKKFVLTYQDCDLRVCSIEIEHEGALGEVAALLSDGYPLSKTEAILPGAMLSLKQV